jgi:uncharacterized protein DUF4384
MNPTPSIPARALTIASLLLAFATAPAFAKVDVELWTDRGDDAVYQSGDAMHLKVRTSDDAWLLVYELDTQGNVNLLYPLKRGSTGRIEGRKTFHLPEDITQDELVVEKETGQGFIVAIAASGPFRDLPWYLRAFDPQAASVGYAEDPEAKAADEEGFDENGRAVGDPYVVMERIRRRVLTSPEDLESFGTAYTTYYVHEQVRYPRYVCNDCHRPGSWSWWPGFDPYYAHCSVVDFRVNWGWAWGPQIWTAYVPYYYYIVRTDCPPMYRTWATTNWRFSSWDGRVRWTNLWGGQLRRFKPATAPVGYTPPPAPGRQWKGGSTPPGYVPPDVRREGGVPGVRPVSWLQRDRGDGKPVWRAPGGTLEKPRFRPDGGGISSREGGTDAGRIRTWRGWTPPQGGTSRGGSGTEASKPRWFPRGGSEPAQQDNGGGGGGGGGNEHERSRPMWRPSGDSPQSPPPQRQDPPRGEPVYKQSPPPSQAPHQSPPQGKPEFRGGQGARPAGGGKGR